MAKNRRKGKDPKPDDAFFAAGKKGPVSRAYFQQMQRKLWYEVHNRIDKKELEFNRLAQKYNQRVKRTLAQRTWEAATTTALENYWAAQYAVKALQAEYEWAKTILDENKMYGSIVRFKPSDLGWAYQRVTDAPKAETVEHLKVVKSRRKFRRTRISWDFKWHEIVKRVRKNPELARQLKSIRKNLKDAEVEVEVSQRNLELFIGAELQLLSIKSITKEHFEKILNQSKVPLIKNKIKFYSMLENWWAFWHRFVTQSDIGASKSFVEEIARRKHNATNEKIKAMHA